MKIFKILLSIIAIPLGVFFIIYSEIDDSPGGQMIGLVIAILGIVGIVKSRKKS